MIMLSFKRQENLCAKWVQAPNKNEWIEHEYVMFSGEVQRRRNVTDNRSFTRKSVKSR